MLWNSLADEIHCRHDVVGQSQADDVHVGCIDVHADQAAAAAEQTMSLRLDCIAADRLASFDFHCRNGRLLDHKRHPCDDRSCAQQSPGVQCGGQ